MINRADLEINNREGETDFCVLDSNVEYIYNGRCTIGHEISTFLFTQLFT